MRKTPFKKAQLMAVLNLTGYLTELAKNKPKRTAPK